MMPVPQHDNERALIRLREMKEVDLHNEVVIPLLTNMGASHIRYVHGAFERGKDIIYLTRDFFGKDELNVCQVKNEKLTGDFSSSSSTATLLLQAMHSARTEVLNPSTTRKELPSHVIVMSTYPLPDSATADAEPLLTDFRAKCMFVGPEKLVQLLRDHLMDLFTELAHPGSGFIAGVRRYVALHHEAQAFDLPSGRSISEFFVNLGLTQTTSILAQLLSGTLRPATMHLITVPKREYLALLGAYDRLKDVLGDTQCFDLAPPKTSSAADSSDIERNIDREDTVTLRQFNISAMLRRFQDYLNQVQRDICNCGSDLERLSIQASAINHLRDIDECLHRLNDWLGDQVLVRGTKREVSSIQGVSFREVAPEAFLSAREDICIIGSAGAGKTCLARIIAQRAIDQGLRCVYFPCSWIRKDSDTLGPAIAAFLDSLVKESSNQDSRTVLEGLDLLILDGCDEARTFGSTLAGDLGAFCDNPTMSERFPALRGIQPFIPEDLENDVVVQGDVDAYHITVNSRLSESDYSRLIAGNGHTSYQTGFEKLAKRSRGARPRILLTTRVSSELDLPNTFQCVELRPFDDEQLVSFYANWFKGKDASHQELLAFLDANPRVKEICRTPLIATIVAALHENRYDLPRSRVEIYQKRFDLLLDRWDRARGIASRTTVNKIDKLHFLSRIALRLHLAHARSFTLRLAQTVWNTGFQRLYPSYRFEDVLHELRYSNSLVFPESSDTFSLGHLSYQEYLAAYAIVSGQRIATLVKHYFDPWWRQALIFYAGISGDIGRLLDLIQSRVGIHDSHGLLDEMMYEARYTSPFIRQVVDDILAEGALDEEVGPPPDEVQNKGDGDV